MTVLAASAARVTAVAERRFELHWTPGREAWPNAPDFTARVIWECGAAAEQAASALTEETAVNTEIIAASCYGMAHVAELLYRQLRDGGPKWIQPEMFLYYSPHSIVSSTAIRLGLGGSAITLLGPRSGMQALAQAVRRVRATASQVLVLAYDVLTPFAVRALSNAGEYGTDAEGVAVAVLLGPASRGDRPVIDVREASNVTTAGRVWIAGPRTDAERFGPAERPSLPPASAAIAPLLALARCTDDPRDQPDVILSGDRAAVVRQ